MTYFPTPVSSPQSYDYSNRAGGSQSTPLATYLKMSAGARGVYHIYMADECNDQPGFICDAMLGGLARWLRAAGYDAEFEYGIHDAELIRRAKESGRTILSCDGPLFDRNIIKNGLIKAIYVPQQLDKFGALRYVMRKLKLPLRTPRCMACGGAPAEVPKHTVMGEAPPLAYRNCEQFWRCSRCGKLLWHGTHWQKITRRLGEIANDG